MICLRHETSHLTAHQYISRDGQNWKKFGHKSKTYELRWVSKYQNDLLLNRKITARIVNKRNRILRLSCRRQKRSRIRGQWQIRLGEEKQQEKRSKLPTTQLLIRYHSNEPWNNATSKCHVSQSLLSVEAFSQENFISMFMATLNKRNYASSVRK